MVYTFTDDYLRTFLKGEYLRDQGLHIEKRCKGIITSVQVEEPYIRLEVSDRRKYSRTEGWVEDPNPQPIMLDTSWYNEIIPGERQLVLQESLHGDVVKFTRP